LLSIFNACSMSVVLNDENEKWSGSILQTSVTPQQDNILQIFASSFLREWPRNQIISV